MAVEETVPVKIVPEPKQQQPKGISYNRPYYCLLMLGREKKIFLNLL